MTKKYVIISEENGIFLGIRDSRYLIFSNIEAPFGHSVAIVFDDKEDADLFISKFMTNIDGNIYTREVETETNYVGVVELIKQGFDTGYMMEHMKQYSNEIH